MSLQSEYRPAQLVAWTTKALDHKDFRYLEKHGERMGTAARLCESRRYPFPYHYCLVLVSSNVLLFCSLFSHFLIFLSPNWANNPSNSIFALLVSREVKNKLENCFLDSSSVVNNCCCTQKLHNNGMGWTEGCKKCNKLFIIFFQITEFLIYTQDRSEETGHQQASLSL